MAWNVIKDFLLEIGDVTLYGSKDATREAFKAELIKDGDVWMGKDKIVFGLKDTHIKLIQSVFSSYSGVDKAVIYGSRAKGNYSTGSDIDLTLNGDDINLGTLLKMENELDDLLLPYKIDLSIFHKIEDPDLLDHINRAGIIFYEKNR